MNKEELRKYALLKGLNLGQAEKDYYQTIILFILYSKVSKELVFKGGTALAKCYGLNRFSEDLDFTVTKPKEYVRFIDAGLKTFGINYTIKEIERIKSSKKYKIKIEGPLYVQSLKTLCTVTLDFSFREPVVLEPEIKTIGYHMDIIPVFEVYTLKEEEIVAEKVRAIMTRTSARDMYDLVFLLNKHIKLDINLINRKLKLTNLEFDKTQFFQKCRALNSVWQSELSPLIKNVPKFSEYLKSVECMINKRFIGYSSEK